MSFWSIPLDADSPPSELSVTNQKGGIAVRFEARAGERLEIIGLVNPSTVARPKIFLWDEETFQLSEKNFERWGGALVGAFFVLAIFSALVGALNKDWSFFLFSGWLITSLRVASINDGWDLLWLGIDLQGDHLHVVLRATLAAHALITISLFRSLLANELGGLWFDRWLKIGSIAFGTLVVASIATPYDLFFPILWSMSALGIATILASLAVIVHNTRSSVSIWYGVSWLITFSGILTEVAYAAGLASSSVPGLNSQTASIASAVVTAIALAEKLRVERLARMEAQREKFEALEKLTSNYNSMPVGLFSINSSGFLSLYNPAFSTMFGLDSFRTLNYHPRIEDIIGKEAHSELCGTKNSDHPREIEFRVQDKEGSARWFLTRVATKDGSIEGSIQDITTRKLAEHKLQYLVDHDPLTGMLNRRGLEMKMRAATAAVDAGATCAIAHVDIDRFKLVNDLYGHSTGDDMLKVAAKRLHTVVRGSDFVARIGDSFVVLFMNCPDRAVLRLSERLRESIVETPFEIEGKRLNVTASIGVVLLELGMSGVDAMAAADRACLEAKARGRNCVVVLEDQDATLKVHRDELKMVASLQREIFTDRYFLEFQPIVSLGQPFQTLSYEVLTRIRGEDGLTVPPARFIGVAERNGLMPQIDRWVLRETLKWLDTHPEHRDRLTFATLNISGASLNDVRFVDDAFAMIIDHPLAMTKLCFEITETIALRDVASTRRFVDRVRSYGSKVALDDFGAGYTSFNYLKEIPADFIKIDGAFIRDINQNPANYAITRTIVDLTHQLGMDSVAEWAETPDTVATLMALGVDYAQGYGLARPLAQDAFTHVLSSGDLVRDPAVIKLLTAGKTDLVSLQSIGGARL